MAIDYIINHACPARKNLGSEGIIHLVKAKNRAEGLFQRFLDNGMTEEEAMDAQFAIQTYTANGEPKSEMVTIRGLMKQAELLEDYEEHCKGCEVAFEQPYGCYNAINYPISAQAETWLAICAERAIKTGLPNSILVKFILDENVTGEFFGNMRTGYHQRYLEHAAPLEITVEKKLLRKTTINTNQILDMFFAVGDMQPVHQQFLLLFSGGLTIQTRQPDLSKIGTEYQAAAMPNNEGGTDYWVFRMMDEMRDDQSIRQIKAFLRALFAAHCTGNTVSIDY